MSLPSDREWGCIPVILALVRQMQKDHKFQASLSYIVRRQLLKSSLFLSDHGLCHIDN